MYRDCQVPLRRRPPNLSPCFSRLRLAVCRPKEPVAVTQSSARSVFAALDGHPEIPQRRNQARVAEHAVVVAGPPYANQGTLLPAKLPLREKF